MIAASSIAEVRADKADAGSNGFIAESASKTDINRFKRLLCHGDALAGRGKQDMRALSPFALVAVFLLCACAGEKPGVVAVVNDNPSPYAKGQSHTEPLYYNGRTYRVQFRHVIEKKVFDVNVSAPGRVLGKTAEDKRIASEVGRNAVNHFACKDSQKARVLDESAKPTAAGWKMQARCG
jgi:hypothetical protein